MATTTTTTKAKRAKKDKPARATRGKSKRATAAEAKPRVRVKREKKPAAEDGAARARGGTYRVDRRSGEAASATYRDGSVAARVLQLVTENPDITVSAAREKLADVKATTMALTFAKLVRDGVFVRAAAQ